MNIALIYCIYLVLLLTILELIFEVLYETKTVENTIDINITTSIKGIAILLITISHIAGLGGTRIFTPLGGIGVSIFLFFSGYGITLSAEKKGVKCFWIKRIIGVYVPYVIIALLISITSYEYNLFDFFRSIVFVKSIVPYSWYLIYLSFWYLVFWLSFKYDKKQLYVISGAILISFFLMPEIMAEQSLSFPMGMLYAMKKTELYKKNNFKRSVGLFIIGVLFLAIKQIPKVRTAYEPIMKLIQLCIKLPLALFVIFVSFYILKKYCLDSLRIIGKYSFEIYLIHGYILLMLEQVIYVNNLIGILTFIVLTGGLSIAFNHVYRRFKVTILNKASAI